MDKDFYDKFAQHFYVDNLVISVADAEEGIALHDRANRIFNQVSMELAQWGTNNATVRASFDQSAMLHEDVTKVLGLMWDMAKDVMYLKPKEQKGAIMTKRQFLHSV